MDSNQHLNTCSSWAQILPRVRMELEWLLLGGLVLSYNESGKLTAVVEKA